MNDSLMPEWMKKKQQQNELLEAKREAERQREMAAHNLIQLKAPGFLKELEEKLAIAVEFLPKLQMEGLLTSFIGGLRVSVSKPGIFANQTYTDLHINTRDIRCTMLNGGAYTLPFAVVSDTEIGVAYDSMSGAVMNASKASEYIIGRMIDMIESMPSTRN
jgi:hypothetical protein